MHRINVIFAPQTIKKKKKTSSQKELEKNSFQPQLLLIIFLLAYKIISTFTKWFQW